MYFTFKESPWLYSPAYCLLIVRAIRLENSDLEHSSDASFGAFADDTDERLCEGSTFLFHSDG